MEYQEFLVKLNKESSSRDRPGAPMDESPGPGEGLPDSIHNSQMVSDRKRGGAGGGLLEEQTKDDDQHHS